MMRILLAAVLVLLPLQAAMARTVTVLALGDSLTAGLGLEPSETFPVRLEQALQARGLDARVINAGVSGDTAAAGLARLDWALGDDVDAVIVELGANDALRGIDPAETEAALDGILRKLGERKLPVLLAGMRAPRNLGSDYAGRFDPIYERLALKHGAGLYPFFLSGVAADPSLNQQDGLHPNGEGVEKIVNGILPLAAGLVRRAGQAN